MKASLRRIRVAGHKEFLHIVRDPQTLAIVILMPVIMMFLYGYALNSDIHDAQLLVEAPIPSTASRALVSRLDASTFFSVPGSIPASADPLQPFRSDKLERYCGFRRILNLPCGGPVARRYR